MASSSSFSLREWHKASVCDAFRAGWDADGGAPGADGAHDAGAARLPSDWCVCIYDATSMRVLSSALTSSELRALCVTLHLRLDARRDAIPDASAVYLITPTSDSMRRMTADVCSGTYARMSVCATGRIAREDMDAAATAALRAGAVPRIARIVERYVQFECPSPWMFLCVSPRDVSFRAYAHPRVSERDVESFAADAAHAAFCVCTTLGVFPIIVASPGGPADVTAQLLTAALRDFASSGTHTHTHTHVPALPSGRRPVPMHVAGGVASSAVGARPLLLLLDRHLDVATPLAHGQSYAALAHDTLGGVGGVGASWTGRVTLDDDAKPHESAGKSWLADLGLVSGPGEAGKPRSVVLDTDTDAFWRTHTHAAFPAAIDAHERETNALAERERVIRRAAGGETPDDASLAAAGVLPDAGSNAELVSAIDSLPVLMRRKALLQTHATVMRAIMNHVAARLIPTFYECELPALTGAPSGMPRMDVHTLVADGTKGNAYDRLRLAAVYLLTAVPSALGVTTAAPSLSTWLAEECAALLDALRSSLRKAQTAPAADAAAPPAAPPVAPSLTPESEACLRTATAVFSYIRQLRAFPGTGGLSGARTDAVSSVGGRFLSSLTAAGTQIFNKAAASVQRFVSGEARLPFTRVFASVMEGKLTGAPGFALESFTVRDPRAPGSARETTLPAFLASLASAAPGGGPAVGGSSSTSPSPFRNGILFVTGGGTFTEAAEIEAYAHASAPPRVCLYGATDMPTPVAFLEHMAACAAQV